MRTRFAPLVSDRLAALQAVRLVVAATAAVSFTVLDLGPSWSATPALLGWLLVTTLVEVLRRSLDRSHVVVSAALALDVLMIGVVIARSGGFRSPLIGLVYLHVVAVSLLLSHRIGMRVAMLHGAALIVSFVLASSGRWGGLALSSGMTVSSGARLAALHAGAFLVVSIGVSAFSAMNEQVARRGHTEVALLADLGKRLSTPTSTDDALVATATLLLECLRVDGVSVAVTDGFGGCRAVRFDGRAVTFVEPDEQTAAAVSTVRATALVHLLHDADPRLEALLPDRTNVIVVPFDAGVVLVAAGGGPRRQVPASTILVVEQVGRLLGSALERARLVADLERLATTDPLTGLANRRLFEETLHRELERVGRSREPLALAVLDIDHFKRVNDEHGHDMGDAVLRHFGRSLADAARDADLPARFGGEEFVVLLPGCDDDAALAAVDRLRRAAVAGDSPLAITASAGVAVVGPTTCDAASLFAAADTALYEAKRGGRDRTVVAPSGRRRLIALAG